MRGLPRRSRSRRRAKVRAEIGKAKLENINQVFDDLKAGREWPRRDHDVSLRETISRERGRTVL
jgi:hypothetical protein